MTYPNIDDLVGILKNKGRGSLMFKKHLKRAYRQFPICPGDLHLVDFNWNGYLFADRVLSMSLRSSAQICQRITTSITFMYFKLGYMMVNYLDDFGGVETKEKDWKAYETLGELLMSCGLEESVDKAVTPTTKMTFLGVILDSEKMTLEVTPDRVVDISLLVESWLKKKKIIFKITSISFRKVAFCSWLV
jgi:hypothetical protein